MIRDNPKTATKSQPREFELHQSHLKTKERKGKELELECIVVVYCQTFQ